MVIFWDYSFKSILGNLVDWKRNRIVWKQVRQFLLLCFWLDLKERNYSKNHKNYWKKYQHEIKKNKRKTEKGHVHTILDFNFTLVSMKREESAECWTLLQLTFISIPLSILINRDVLLEFVQTFNFFRN